VGSFVSSVGSAVSSGLPTDEEIEREAERDRERSRREAELILTQEAEERRQIEEKVLAMLNISATPPKHISPARSHSMPPMENPSPTSSQRDGAVSSWWNAAKNRLTPTKEPLTAAQQVIQEAKEKEKREKKEAKKVVKERKRSADWPAVPENKFSNPTLLSLATPPKPPPTGASLSAPPSPTPGAQGLPSSLPSSLPPSLAPSPLRPDSRNASPSRSPSREPPPLYTQFTDQGSLDVPGTLLVVARRFEKLEKWTVGHVRALEERMSDVERWLVDKENEKGGDGGEGTSKVNESPALEGTVNEMRDELMEMQGRIGELGREMAKFATSPGMLSTMPTRVSAQAVSTAPQTNSSFAIHAQTSSSITVHSHSLPPNTPQPSVSRISSYGDLRRRDSVSPPFIPPSAIRAEQPRSRLPYPTGDYTSPSGSVVAGQGALSPPQSPPTTSNSGSASPAGAVAVAVRSRPVSVAGLPAPSPPPPASAPAGLPPARTGFTLAAPPEQPARARSSSISPTPRKRYTVALGEPIMKPRISASPPPISVGDDDDDDDGANDAEEEDSVDRTIGRSMGRHASSQHKKGQRSNGVGLGFGLGLGLGMGNGTGEDTDTSVDSAPRSARPSRPRVHPRTTSRSPSSAQSMASSNANAGGSRMNTQRLLGHGRALSIDRAAAAGASPRTKPRSSTTTTTPTTPASASATMGFKDPLVVRREEIEARAKTARPPPKVVTGKPRAPVGELVAYFDKS
jgi:hypothetical protein